MSRTSSPRRARRASVATAIGFGVVLVGGCAGGDGVDTAARSAQVARVAPSVDVRPQQLLGLDSTQLDGLLGAADFKRNDGPAEIWQFRDSACVLDVFLYADPGGVYRVEHVQGRDRSLGGSADDTCVADLLRARRSRVAG